MTAPGTTAPNTALNLLFGETELAPGSLTILGQDAEATLHSALKMLSPAERATALRRVAEIGAELLDVNLINMLVAGWRIYDRLTDAARNTLAKPGSKELVYAATHRITVEQNDSIKILVDAHLIISVPLKLSVEFNVTALVAEVAEGRLEAIHAGYCDITATLAADGIDVVKGQTRLELPGVVRITSGIRLLPAKEYPPSTHQPGAEPTIPKVPESQPVVIGPTPVTLPRQIARPDGE